MTDGEVLNAEMCGNLIVQDAIDDRGGDAKQKDFEGFHDLRTGGHNDQQLRGAIDDSFLFEPSCTVCRGSHSIDGLGSSNSEFARKALDDSAVSLGYNVSKFIMSA